MKPSTKIRIKNLLKPLVEQILKEESAVTGFIETWVDGKQMLGSDGTNVIRGNLYGRGVDNAFDLQKNKIISISKSVKDYLKTAQSIELRLVNKNGKVLKKMDITHDITSLDEAKTKFNSGSIQHKYDTIAKLTGTRAEAVKNFCESNNLDTLQLMMDIGQKILSAGDFASALSGKPGNRIQVGIINKYKNK
jgi:hypothetical protein